jgi:putative heme-binding domain-containing protein
MELVEGQTQYGRRRDDWGNWFGNNNPNWLWSYYFPEYYLKRNPYLAVKSLKRNLANYEGRNRVFPVGKPQQRFNWPDAIREVTSANSAAPYRDELFGKEFESSIFISEPANNVVHREVIDDGGVPLTSRRAASEQSSEFLASSDRWFRPTTLKTGPDGALYIADIYRLVVEHPEYFPEELKKRPDLRAGEDRGRIYRVVPKGKSPGKIPRLKNLSAADLVASLRSPNGWVRDTAQRLLIERADAGSVALLRQLASDGAAAPKTKIQSLWALRGLKALTPEIAATALRDKDRRVRRGALVVCENSLDAFMADAAFRESIESITRDPEISVRYQAALSFGEGRRPEIAALLVEILRRDGGNELIQNAVLSSAPAHATDLSRAVEGMGGWTGSEFTNVVENLRRLSSSSATGALPFRLVYKTNSLSAAARSTRQKLAREYLATVSWPGRSMEGRELFQRNCATCHRFKNEGAAVGPDLGTVSDKPEAELATSILDPNAAVDPVFTYTEIRLRNGTEWSGVVASETANSITLRSPGGAEQAFLRPDLEQLIRTDRSLMPEGFEQALTSEELADLIAYLKGR